VREGERGEREEEKEREREREKIFLITGMSECRL
jgi:hypothetical protein